MITALPNLRLVKDPEPQDTLRQALSLDEAYRRYSSYVASISLRLLGRDSDVDDVVQDVFLEAIKGLQQLRDPDAVKGWLATVTVRTARRKLRMRYVKGLLGLDDLRGLDYAVAPGASPEQHALLGRIYEVMDELPADDRIAWVLRCVQMEKLEDVARYCGCSLATAKRRVAAAQQVVERKLADG